MEAFLGFLGTLGPVIEVGKSISGPIKRHLNDLYGFSDNIQSLSDEAQKLNDKNGELQMQVDAAENNAQVIYPKVKTWLKSASQSKDIIKGIETDVPKVRKRPLDLISRYSLSKKARKTAEAIRVLCDECNFDQISQDATPAAMISLPLGPKEEFESRKKIEEDVMEVLRDRNVNKIGLCGMGGIGKTTMAERIKDRVMEEKLFEGALKVVVSQQVEMLKIQQNIANQLRLNLEATEDLETRAGKILTGLKGKKSTLVVLDDVWEGLKLRELGIPFNNTSGRCTVLFTSRDRGVLEEMETQKIFGIQGLSDKEAWSLFTEKTGYCADREDLRFIAENVANECKGLPVALVTVGLSLRNKANRRLWEDALFQLRSSNPTDLPRGLAGVYNSLKLSFDSLENESAGSLFLLCSMFEEDSNIDLDILTWYGMGLGVLENFQKLNDARNRTHTLVEVLKDRSLLLDVSEKNCVRMHDVIRDMAIYVASKERRCGFVINRDDKLIDWASLENFYKDCSWISISSSRDITKFPVELKFPSLRLLRLEGGEGLEGGEELSDKFFDEIREINVLSMTNIWIESFPPTTRPLKNLRTLLLFYCGIESINVVGELSELEVLCCRFCDGIKTLPKEIGRLNRLRLLEITNCRNFCTIVPGVISSLVNLEELELRDNGWKFNEASRAAENVALAELESLKRLTRLEIEINDVNSVAQEICLPPKVEKYDIAITEDRIDNSERNTSFHKSLHLEIPGEMKVGNWIQKLLRDTEFLTLRGDGASQVNFAELLNVKSLSLGECSSVKKLGNSGALNLLESLHLSWLEGLEEIIPAESNNYSFKKLRKLEIRNCSRLRYLFPVSIRSDLSQLEELELIGLKELEEIIPAESNNYFFKKLRKLKIMFCPRLRYLFPVSIRSNLSQLEELSVVGCEGIEDIFYKDDDDDGDDKMEKDGTRHLRMELPKLTTLELEDIGDIGGIPRLTAQQILNEIAASGLKELTLKGFKDNISIGWCSFSFLNNLVRLQISELNGIKNLMSSLVARNLLCLRKLIVFRCSMMLEVVADDEEQQIDKISLFPALSTLQIWDLSELRSFCQWKYNHALEMPSLDSVFVNTCPKMETFTLGSLSTPKLKDVNIGNFWRSTKVEDLNEVIQRYFKLQESTSKLRTQKGEKQEGSTRKKTLRKKNSKDSGEIG